MTIYDRTAVLFFNRGFQPFIDAFERINYQVLSYRRLPLANEATKNVSLALFDMYELVKSPFRAMRLKRALNKLGIPVFVWNRDGPANKGDKHWRQWLLKKAPLFDFYASHTAQEIFGTPERFVYLPNAAWDTEYNLGETSMADLRDPANYDYDVSFHGRIDSKKYPEMKSRDDFLKELGQRLSAAGISYRFTQDRLSYKDQRIFIQRSKISLNVHASCDFCYHKSVPSEKRERSWGLPERCFGVPACGGFLLSDTRKHGPEAFHGDLEWQEFSDVDDCYNKIIHWLSHFNDLRDVAERQYLRVIAEHTYVYRAEDLVQIANDWREARN
jgi:spore maturation protein CgeB